jgi:MFS family permease
MIRLTVLLVMRIVQGLASGISFQCRFLLANISTSDQHMKLQARAFIAGDLGLGLGALLPAAVSLCSSFGIQQNFPDLWPSLIQAVIHIIFLIWVLVSFPWHIHFLPARIRFPRLLPKSDSDSTVLPKAADYGREVMKYRIPLLMSGTLRVFVQSAIMPTVALLMHDAHITGQYRQTIAVGTLYLLQLPFEALTSRLCCVCATREPTKEERGHPYILASSLIAILVIAVWPFTSSIEGNAQLTKNVLELAGLIVTLAVAAPLNASRLHQLQDAECAIVILEWLKAYVGRLLGPCVAVILYIYVGFGALLTVLCLASLTVITTA